ncbi:hypothetical protein D3C77_566820 [compost metagenome]
MKVVTDDTVEHALLAQVHRTTDCTNELPGHVEYWLRNRHDQIAGHGQVGRTDQGTLLGKDELKAIGTNSGAGNLQGIRIDLKHLALIINNHYGIEICILGL